MNCNICMDGDVENPLSLATCGNDGCTFQICPGCAKTYYEVRANRMKCPHCRLVATNTDMKAFEPAPKRTATTSRAQRIHIETELEYREAEERHAGWRAEQDAEQNAREDARRATVPHRQAERRMNRRARPLSVLYSVARADEPYAVPLLCLYLALFLLLSWLIGTLVCVMIGYQSMQEVFKILFGIWAIAIMSLITVVVCGFCEMCK